MYRIKRFSLFLLSNYRYYYRSHQYVNDHYCTAPLHVGKSQLPSSPFDQENAMSTTTTTTQTQQGMNNNIIPLIDYLRYRKTHPTNHIVIGNDAGDADSIVSAISYGYINDCIVPSTTTSSTTTDDNVLRRQQQQQQLEMTPIISISDIDLQTQRPETMLLLQLVGIIPLQHLIFINTNQIHDAIQQQNQQQPMMINVTLVDHNRFNNNRIGNIDSDSSNVTFNVVSILDHHMDEGYHRETCSYRNIAYANNTALVASTCTLMVEELQKKYSTNINRQSDDDSSSILSKRQYPASLSLLLLGVILLDSINMNVNAGKVTKRDIAAIHDLIDHTDWGQLLPETKEQLHITNNDVINTSQLFHTLQNAKFAPEFWNTLSVRDALRLDYKSFTPSSSTTTTISKFGISTVLISVKDFLTKHDVMSSIKLFMNEMDIELYGIMFAYTNPIQRGDNLIRELVLIATNVSLVDALIEFLMNDGSLQLIEMSDTCDSNNFTLHVRFFQQNNHVASRKQVAPLLLKFFTTNVTL
jgi:exopolyphosphatase